MKNLIILIITLFGLGLFVLSCESPTSTLELPEVGYKSDMAKNKHVKFYLTVYEYNYELSNYEPSNALLRIYADDAIILEKYLDTIVNNIKVLYGHENYILEIEKPGWRTYSKSFTGEELATYYKDKLDESNGFDYKLQKSLKVYLAEETWEYTYGGSSNDRGFGFIKAHEGGYIFTGQTNLGTWVVKLGQNGTVDWDKYYGNQRGYYGIRPTHNMGYLITSNAGVMDLDIDGNVRWSAHASSNVITQTRDLGYVMAEWSGGYNEYIKKYSPAGTLIWSKNSNVFGTCIVEDRYSNDLIIGGFNLIGSRVYTVQRINEYGDILWQKSYGTAYEFPVTMLQNEAGEYLLIGVNYKALKIDQNGNTLWFKNIAEGFHSGSLAMSISPSKDGYLIGGYGYNVTGESTGDKSNYDGLVVEIDESGLLLWKSFVGSTQSERITGAVENFDGDIVIGGYQYNPGTYDNYWAKKFEK